MSTCIYFVEGSLPDPTGKRPLGGGVREKNYARLAWADYFRGCQNLVQEDAPGAHVADSQSLRVPALPAAVARAVGGTAGQPGTA